jgi:hypothetical protein
MAGMTLGGKEGRAKGRRHSDSFMDFTGMVEVDG